MVVLVTLEFLAYARHGMFSWIASRVWIVHGLFYAASSLLLVGRTLGQDIRDRSGLSLLVLGGLTCLIFAGTAGGESVALNGEAAQQVAGALQSSASPDFGYTGVGFLGYPSRQYLLAAAPSIVMGRGFLPLRLGYALPFWTGALVCYCGLRALFSSWGSDTRLAAIAVLSFFTFPYVFAFLQRYEQAILPMAFAMHVIGWTLLCMVRGTLFRFVNLLWPCGMAATSYTPGLALWGLCLVFFVGLGWRRWKGDRAEAIAWLSGALYQAGIGVASLLSRGDLRLKPEGHEFSQNLAAGLKILFFGEPRTFFGPILLLPILLYLLSSLAGREGIAHFAIGAWCLGVAGASIVARGVIQPSADVALLRALVIVPVLLTGMAWRLGRSAIEKRIALPSGSLWLAAAILGVYSVHCFQDARAEFRTTAREVLVRDLIAEMQKLGLKSESAFVLGLVSGNGDLLNLRDFAIYFWPNAEIVQAKELAPVAARLREASPAVAYVDRLLWNPTLVALPPDVRVEPVVHAGPEGLELVRLERKRLAPSRPRGPSLSDFSTMARRPMSPPIGTN